MAKPRNKIGGVYRILIPNSPYVYIGETVSFRSRWHVHRNLLKRNKHDNPLLQFLYNESNNKVPFGFFSIEIVPYFNIDERKNKEREQKEKHLLAGFTLINRPYCYDILNQIC